MDPKKLGKDILLGIGASSVLNKTGPSLDKTNSLSISSNVILKDWEPVKNTTNSNFVTLSPSNSPLLFNQNLYTESNFDFVNSRLTDFNKNLSDGWLNEPSEDFYTPLVQNVITSTLSVTTPTSDIFNIDITNLAKIIDITKPTINTPNLKLNENKSPNTQPTIEYTYDNYRLPIDSNYTISMEKLFLSLGIGFAIPAFLLGLNKLEHSKLTNVIKLIFSTNRYNLDENIDKIVDDIIETIDNTLGTLSPNSKLARYLNVIKKLDLHKICKKYLTKKWTTLNVIKDLNLIQNNLLTIANEKHILKNSFLGGISMIGSGMACILFGITAYLKIMNKRFISLAKLIANYIKSKTYDKLFKKNN